MTTVPQISDVVLVNASQTSLFTMLFQHHRQASANIFSRIGFFLSCFQLVFGNRVVVVVSFG